MGKSLEKINEFSKTRESTARRATGKKKNLIKIGCEKN